MVAMGRWKRAHVPDVSLACALAFHALFGAVHEASHLAAAWWTGRLPDVANLTDSANVVAKAMLGRHVVVAADVSDGHVAFDIDLVRHAGWGGERHGRHHSRDCIVPISRLVRDWKM